MKQETLDWVAAMIAIVGGFSSFSFWLASREIKSELFYRIDKISDNLRGRLETDFIKNTNRLMRWQDKNQLKNATLEARLNRIEKALSLDNEFFEALDSLPENTDLP
ncbi:hypothetical protein C7B67_16435 [filamentous cyanobacterium Phorm 6]|nr:hypothetical protein C7B67_16435 [filamentous cyanobacterium Phorm 6]